MFLALGVGLLCGFLGSIPVAGPISALVLHRGLNRRYASAIWIGWGGALAEGLYALVTFFGFAKYLTKYPWIDTVSRGLAAVILIGLGISFMRYKTKTGEDKKKADSALQSFGLGFTITAINPTLIATWAAMAVTLASAGMTMTPADAVPFSIGAATGIGGWFSVFVWILRRYGERFNPRTLERVVQIIGLAVVGLGVWFVVRFIQAVAPAAHG
ncbi:MAG: LysE family transporter [Polyangiaceae bacterium]